MLKRCILRLTSVLMAMCMITAFAPFYTNAVENNEKVLFEGMATSEFTDWSDWNSAVSLGTSQFNRDDFSSPFTMIVDYQSNDMPIIVFQSWSGGTDWADMIPSYISNGRAYYLFSTISDHYGTDFSNLNSIKVMPNESDLTVTKVSFAYESALPEIKLNGDAGRIAENIKVGWNLGDTLDSHAKWIVDSTSGLPEDFETAWSNPITTKQMIMDIKSAGFNAVRLPVTWKQHMDSNGKVDKAWMERVAKVVDYIISSDMYCILNVHHDTGETGWLRATKDCVDNKGARFSYLWTQISERFKDYDSRLLFESFNEILDDNNNWIYSGKEATDAVNRLNQIFVDSVRATKGQNSTRCLVVNTYAADSDGRNLDEFVMPRDTVKDSIIVEIHCYSPYKYCTHSYPDHRNWIDNNGKNNLDGTFYSLYHNFTSKGIPVIIGEFGVPNKENTDNRYEYVKYFINTAKGYGIKCFYWDPGGEIDIDPQYGYFSGMTLYNRYNLSWAYPQVVMGITGVDTRTAPRYLVGDIDLSGAVDIQDTTILQRYLVNCPSAVLNQTQKILSDTDSDTVICISDVTNVQMYLANQISFLG